MLISACRTLSSLPQLFRRRADSDMPSARVNPTKEPLANLLPTTAREMCRLTVVARQMLLSRSWHRAHVAAAASKTRNVLAAVAGRRWCSSSEPDGDAWDLFDAVDDIAANATSSPANAFSVPSASHHGSAPEAQPKAPAPSYARQFSANPATVKDESSRRERWDNPKETEEARVMLAQRLQAHRDVLKTWIFEYHRPGRTGDHTGEAVAVSQALRSVDRVASRYTLGFERDVRRLAAPVVPSDAPSGAGSGPHDTVEWEAAYLLTATTMAELRQRMGRLRSRAEVVAQHNALGEAEVLNARGAAATLAATQIFGHAPENVRAAIRVDDADSPVAVFAACLRDVGVDRCAADLWAAGFMAAAVQNVDGAFFDKLVKQFLDRHAVATGAEANGTAAIEPIDTAVMDAALCWPAQRGDIPRLLTLHAAYVTSLQSSARSAQRAKAFPLPIYARLIRAAEGTKHDGGLRAAVVEGMRRGLTPRDFENCTWRDIAQILSGLDISSGIGLVRFFSQGREDKVPYPVWLHILRRLCREHHHAESEAMFTFLRARFEQSSNQRDVAVNLLLRMHCTTRPRPNFGAAVHLFATQVVETPKSLRVPGTLEAEVKPTALHYRWLIRAADSAEAANALWTEALADGIAVDEPLYRALFDQSSRRALSALSRNVPDLLPSEFDELLSIPGNVDAHAARERAMAQLGKRLPENGHAVPMV
jgi:hypothetical protein